MSADPSLARYEANIESRVQHSCLVMSAIFKTVESISSTPERFKCSKSKIGFGFNSRPQVASARARRDKAALSPCRPAVDHSKQLVASRCERCMGKAIVTILVTLAAMENAFG